MSVANKPFGLRDLKVYERTADTPTYGTGLDVPCVNKVSFDIEVTNAVLEGDDVKCATHSIPESVKASFESGGLPIDIYDLLMGSTLTDSGSGSGAITLLDIAVSDVRPYFAWIAQAYGSESAGDTIIVGYKAKMMGGGGGELSKGNFYTSSFEVETLPCDFDDDTILRVVHRTTAVAISTTFLSNPVHVPS